MEAGCCKTQQIMNKWIKYLIYKFKINSILCKMEVKNKVTKDTYKLGKIIGKGSVSLIYEDEENDDEVYKFCNKKYYSETNLQLELSFINKLMSDIRKSITNNTLHDEYKKYIYS